jgi:hypothetical protein
MHGISIQVEIVDRCTGCKVNDIDLTPAAFTALAGSLWHWEKKNMPPGISTVADGNPSLFGR